MNYNQELANQRILRELITPTNALCKKCGKPSIFIRTRYFERGTADVWMCQNERCNPLRCYFHTDNSTRPKLEDVKPVCADLPDEEMILSIDNNQSK